MASAIDFDKVFKGGVFKDSLYQQMCDFNTEDFNEIKRAFIMFDKKNDGTIGVKHLGQLLRCLGKNPTETEIHDLILEFDSNRNGSIDFVEFLQMLRSLYGDMNDIIQEAFYIFDQDGSGYISAEEFCKMMNEQGARMPMEEVKEIINEVDADGDGKINLEEFVQLMSGV